MNILWKRKTHKNGFTLIELMTAVVIIGILVAIAVTNFVNSAKKRALEASLSTNMRTLQVMLETYRVDNSSYPDNITVLGTEASAKNYNKSVSNPYTRQSGPVGSTGIWAIDCYDPNNSPTGALINVYVGRVCYQLVSPTKYYLLGYGENAQIIQRNGTNYQTNGG